MSCSNPCTHYLAREVFLGEVGSSHAGGSSHWRVKSSEHTYLRVYAQFGSSARASLMSCPAPGPMYQNYNHYMTLGSVEFSCSCARLTPQVSASVQSASTALDMRIRCYNACILCACHVIICKAAFSESTPAKEVGSDTGALRQVGRRQGLSRNQPRRLPIKDRMHFQSPGRLG